MTVRPSVARIAARIVPCCACIAAAALDPWDMPSLYQSIQQVSAN